MKAMTIAALGLLLTACATDRPDPPRDRATELWLEHSGPSRDRVVFPRTEAWTQLDGDWIAVRTQPNDYYLLRLEPACASDIRFSSSLSLAIRQSSRNMLSRFDTVAAGETRCRIQEIRPVARDALAEDLAAAGLDDAFLRRR